MRPDHEFEFFREDYIALVVLDVNTGQIVTTYTPPEHPTAIPLYAGQRLEFMDTDGGKTVLLPYSHEAQTVYVVWHNKDDKVEFPKDDFPEDIHPSLLGILRFFEFDHLPEGHLRETSACIHALAHLLATDEKLSGPELTVGLRKLLEAKDCFVRAAL